jgi:hypothetical protein
MLGKTVRSLFVHAPSAIRALLFSATEWSRMESEQKVFIAVGRLRSVPDIEKSVNIQNAIAFISAQIADVA